MNTMNPYFDDIEAYLFDQLSATQKSAFEAQMATDAQLASAVQQQQLEHRAMQLLRKQQLRAQFTAWKEEEIAEVRPENAIPSENKSPKWSIRRFLPLAIAASFLLLVGYFLFLRGSSFDAQQLAFNAYPKPDVSNVTRDVTTNTPTDALGKAIEAMQKKQYTEAESLLNEVSATDPNAVKVPLYKGDCQFYQGNYTNALNIFQALLSNDALREQAEFRIVLVLLQQKKYDSAEFKTLVQKIRSNPNHFGNRPVREIAQKMGLE